MRTFLKTLWRNLLVDAHDMAFGRAMLPTVKDIRAYAALSPSLPLDQDRTEVRIYATFVTIIAALLAAEPIWYMYSVPESMVNRVASLVHFPQFVTAAFAVSFFSVFPHLVTLVFFPKKMRIACFRQWAALGTLLGAITWMWLANMAVSLDVGGLEYAYGIRALCELCVAFLFGFSVNAQQLREIIHAARV